MHLLSLQLLQIKLMRDFSLKDKDIFMLILFALLMIAASYSMIKKNKPKSAEAEGPQKFNYPLILIEGAVVGVLTGLVGAGGGFLIIPALVILSKLPMKEAVGTSLAIIAAKSLIGFLGEGTETHMDWKLLLTPEWGPGGKSGRERVRE